MPFWMGSLYGVLFGGMLIGALITTLIGFAITPIIGAGLALLWDVSSISLAVAKRDRSFTCTEVESSVNGR